MKCQKCGCEHNTNFCPNCGAQGAQPNINFRQPTSNNFSQSYLNNNKKTKNTVVALLISVICGLVAFAVIIGVLGSVIDNGTAVTTNDNVSSQVSNEGNQVICNIGDTLNANGLKITFQKFEDWTSNNMFVKPKEGYKFIRAYFVMENTNSNDYSMGGWDFECYADNAKMDMSIYGEDMIDLYSTISSGRKLEGYIYYEVPTSASEIEIEYETNFWTGKKAIFKVK